MVIPVVYIGVAIGSLFQSVADKYGRYPIIYLAGIVISIAGLLSCFSPGYYFFLVIRMIYGFGIGIILPLSGTYLT
jgi:MFS family permease